MYCMVRTFRDTSSGYMLMFLMNLIIGVTTTACIFLLSLFEYIKVRTCDFIVKMEMCHERLLDCLGAWYTLNDDNIICGPYFMVSVSECFWLFYVCFLVFLTISCLFLYVSNCFVTVSCQFMSFFWMFQVIAISHHYLSKIFLIFPQFCLGNGLVLLSQNQLVADVYQRFDIDKYAWPFSFDMIGWHLVAMGVEGVVFFLVTLITDSRLTCSRWEHFYSLVFSWLVRCYYIWFYLFTSLSDVEAVYSISVIVKPSLGHPSGF